MLFFHVCCSNFAQVLPLILYEFVLLHRFCWRAASIVQHESCRVRKLFFPRYFNTCKISTCAAACSKSIWTINASSRVLCCKQRGSRAGTWWGDGSREQYGDRGIEYCSFGEITTYQKPFSFRPIRSYTP